MRFDFDDMPTKPGLFFEPLRNINKDLHPKIYSRFFDGGVNIMEKDWDNLIILDSLRTKEFESLCDFDGKMDSVLSKGSNSREFVVNNFQDKKFFDTIIVTSNSHYNKDLDNPDQKFYFIEDFYSVDADPKLENLVENRKIVTIDQINRTIELCNEYPNKRIITHIMPPHVAYFSQEAIDLRKQIFQEYDIAFYFEQRDEYNKRKESKDYDWWEYAVDLHHACRLGLVSDETIRRLYKKDLEWILEQIKPLNEELDGKTVITGDHGELLGERLPPLFLKHYTHPPDTYSNIIREVPWFILPYENRRKITSESPVKTQDISEDEIKDNLESLGYI